MIFERLRDFTPRTPVMDHYDSIIREVEHERIKVIEYFGYLSIKELKNNIEAAYFTDSEVEFAVVIPRRGL